MRTLKEVKCKSTVTVVKLHGEGAVKRRIMDMGITKGTEVYVRKLTAPLCTLDARSERAFTMSCWICVGLVAMV